MLSRRDRRGARGRTRRAFRSRGGWRRWAWQRTRRGRKDAARGPPPAPRGPPLSCSCRPWRSWSYRPLVGDTPLHDHEQIVPVLEEVQILERVALEDEEIGVLAGLDRADAGLHPRALGIGAPGRH